MQTPTPREVKAHGPVRAQALLDLGWTLKHEFKDEDGETCEWYFVWELPSEPKSVSPSSYGA